MAPFGEIPRYIHERDLRSYISRNLQLKLCDAPELQYVTASGPVTREVFRDNRGRKVDGTTWRQQPRKWPRRDRETKEERRDYWGWRRKYEAEWIAFRKSLGLPHEILNPAPPERKPCKRAEPTSSAKPSICA